jgi:Amidohydrolase family
MRKAVLALAIATALGGAAGTSEQRSLVFTNATVIDVKSGHLVRGQTIVITAKRISALSSHVEIPAGATVMDAGGRFVVPGFWDMHTHALWSTNQIQRMLSLFLANGITGIRDMGSPLPLDETLLWRSKVADGAILGPRIFAAGKLIDGPQPVWQGSVAVATDQQAKEAVDDLQRHDVDFIKVYSRLPREAYFAVAAETKRSGTTFVGHVPIYVSAKEASAAGQRSIEHLSEILFACSRDEADLRKRLIATKIGDERERVRKDQLKIVVNTFSQRKAWELSSLFAKNDTWQVPTLTVQHAFAFANPLDLQRSRGVRYVPASAVASWVDRLASFRKTRDDEDMAVQKRSYELEIQVVQMMRKAGVHFMAGTDAETFFPSGFGLQTELALFVAAGFSPLEALQAEPLSILQSISRRQRISARSKSGRLLILCFWTQTH